MPVRSDLLRPAPRGGPARRASGRMLRGGSARGGRPKHDRRRACARASRLDGARSRGLGTAAANGSEFATMSSSTGPHGRRAPGAPERSPMVLPLPAADPMGPASQRGSGRRVQAAARGPGVCERLVPPLPVVSRAPANRERGVCQLPGDGGPGGDREQKASSKPSPVRRATERTRGTSRSQFLRARAQLGLGAIPTLWRPSWARSRARARRPSKAAFGRRAVGGCDGGPGKRARPTRHGRRAPGRPSYPPMGRALENVKLSIDRGTRALPDAGAGLLSCL